MLWKYACTCITIINLVDGLRQLNQQKWIWRLFSFIILQLYCQRKKGRNNNIGYAYFKGTISLVQTHSRCFTDSQFVVVRSLLDYQQPNADQFKQMCISKCCKIVINQFVDCAVYFVSLVQFCLLMQTFPPSSTENPHLAYESGTCYLTPGRIYFKPKCWEDKLSWAFLLCFQGLYVHALIWDVRQSGIIISESGNKHFHRKSADPRTGINSLFTKIIYWVRQHEILWYLRQLDSVIELDIFNEQ